MLVVISGLCFYASGLLVNDLADVERDRAERPSRPLPSGMVSCHAVRLVAMKLMALGLLFCLVSGARTLATGAVLVAAVLAYNLKLKDTHLGPWAMGACRGLSFLMGAAFAASWSNLTPGVAAALVTLTLYIVAVTRVARRETEEVGPGASAWLPPLAGALGLGVLTAVALSDTTNLWAFAAVAGMAWAVSLAASVSLSRGRAVPAAVGGWLGALLLYQSAFCLAAGNIGAGAVGCALWPCFTILGRHFPPS